MNNSYLRGGVTGVGLVTASVGVRDLASLVAAWWTSDPARGERPS